MEGDGDAEGVDDGRGGEQDSISSLASPISSGRERGSTETGTGGGSVSSLESSSWNWNQAQTADGRTYYFNEKKQVKWNLTLEEKMKVRDWIVARACCIGHAQYNTLVDELANFLPALADAPNSRAQLQEDGRVHVEEGAEAHRQRQERHTAHDDAPLEDPLQEEVLCPGAEPEDVVLLRRHEQAAGAGELRPAAGEL